MEKLWRFHQLQCYKKLRNVIQMAQLLTKFYTFKGWLISNYLEWMPALNPNKQTTKPCCQQFLHRRTHDFGDKWAHTFLGSLVQLHKIHILLAPCKSILYGILLSLIHTHCLVHFDVKPDSMYTHLCCIHCAFISSTPVQDLHCFVETWGAHLDHLCGYLFHPLH